MSEHRELAAAPQDESWARIERIVERFEDDLRQGKQPALSDYLLDGEALLPELLVELIRAELEFRLEGGEAARVEEYLARYPELADERQAVLALLQTEWRIRARLDPQLSVEEYRQRFPTSAQELARVLCPVSFERAPDWPVTLDTHMHHANPSSSPASVDFDMRGYELNEQLGKGGMGEVYRCCDPALGRDLAIKVVKKEYCGHEAIKRRFIREARITGSLQHPSIVAVHNLGRLSDGRLHYTMRLVRGRTFADILKEEAGKPERLTSLLAIFQKVCEAVAYAHSKRVIHRDLKPVNIMVGKFGEVQVMDWGLAKLLTPEGEPAEEEPRLEAGGTLIHTEAADTPSDLTRAGAAIGTPAYMSPEHAQGDWELVDERADVFSLGAILCEMLTGEPPYSGENSNEILRRAKGGDLADALVRLEQCGVDAALTALCRECLNPKRENRPRDADAVAKRVAEYQARVQDRLRQAEVERAEAQLRAREGRKQRHLLIALVLALLAGGALSTWQAVRATAERNDKEIALENAKEAAEAERQAKDAEAAQREKTEEETRIAEANERKAKESKENTDAVLTFFNEKVLSAGRPLDQKGGMGKDVTLRQAVDKAKKDIAASFKDRPLVEASIRDTLGSTYLYLGEYPEAILQHERALALFEAKLGPDHSETLASRSNLANTYQVSHRINDAIRLHEQTLKQRKAKFGPDHPDTLVSCNNLSSAYWLAGRTADALRLNEQTLKLSESKLGTDHSITLRSRNDLASVYWSLGRSLDAIRLHEQNLRLCEPKLGLHHPNTLIYRNNLAAAYHAVGRIAEAIPLLENILKQMEDVLGLDHPKTLGARNNLAAAYWSTGKLDRSIPLFERNLKLYEAKLVKDHPKGLQRWQTSVPITAMQGDSKMPSLFLKGRWIEPINDPRDHLCNSLGFLVFWPIHTTEPGSSPKPKPSSANY